MGAIRKVIESFDNSSELGQAQRELVENLAKLAESKAEFFELDISTSLRTAASEDNKTIPVEAVLATTTQTHAFTAQSVAGIPDAVTKSLRSFVSGTAEGIITGIGALLSEAVTTFLGSGDASTGTLKQYFVVTEGSSIVRVDVRAWYLSVEAASIKNQIQKVSAFVGAKSAVDVSRIKFNTFLNIYDLQLRQMRLPEDDVLAALEQAEKIFRRFNPDPRGFMVNTVSSVSEVPAVAKMDFA